MGYLMRKSNQKLHRAHLEEARAFDVYCSPFYLN